LWEKINRNSKLPTSRKTSQQRHCGLDPPSLFRLRPLAKGRKTVVVIFVRDRNSKLPTNGKTNQQRHSVLDTESPISYLDCGLNP